MRGRIVDWEMSLRYKYPTINTDTYTLDEKNRRKRRLGRGDEDWGEGRDDGMRRKKRKEEGKRKGRTEDRWEG